MAKWDRKVFFHFANGKSSWLWVLLGILCIISFLYHLKEAVRAPLKTAELRGVRLKGRWPLPDISLALRESDGKCVLREDVCNNPDPYLAMEDVHVRDIISSSLMQCMFKEGCRAVDIGGNMGIMTATMLQLGAYVISIEPQQDLCAAIKRTAMMNAWEKKLDLHCGGIRLEDNNNFLELHYGSVYRIGGTTRNDTVHVPLFKFQDIAPPGTYQFLKIDTDSLDCQILATALNMTKSGMWNFISIVLETWDAACPTLLPETVHGFQTLGFQIYRTLLWERQFSRNGSMATALAGAVPPFATEKFNLRFSR